MGLFSSDYEAYAGLATNQLLKQRSHEDTRIKEILLYNMRSGDSLADSIRDDILKGNTYAMHSFYRWGKKYNWINEIIYDIDDKEQEYYYLVSLDRAIDSFETYHLGTIAIGNQSYSDMSANLDFGMLNHEYNGSTYIGYITIGGSRLHVSDVYTTGNNTIGVTATDGVTVLDYDTGYQAGSDANKDKYGFFAVYKYAGISYYYFSDNSAFSDDATGTSHDYEFTPVVSLKDNWSESLPYYQWPKDSDEYKQRKKLLRKLNIDFEDISKEILDPGEIPDVGTSLWHRSYGKQWRDDESLQQEFPTEQEYHDDLVKDHKEMKDNVDKITDAHIGLFAMPKFLDEASIIAMYYSLYPIIMLGGRGTKQKNNRHPSEHWKSIVVYRKYPAYYVELKSGSFYVNLSFYDASICRRKGIVRNKFDVDGEPPRRKRRKQSYYIYTRQCAGDKNGTIINEEGYGGDENDPVVQNIYGDVIDVEELKKVNDDDNIGECRMKIAEEYYNMKGWCGASLLELRFQDKPLPDGSPSYLEMRISGLMMFHKVSVREDSEYGKSFTETVVANICNHDGTIKGDTLTDAVMIPLTWYGIKKTPIFLRDRLLRESLICSVQSITVQEIKWYQRGIFKVIFIIVSIAISWFTGGMTLASLMTAIATTLVNMAISLIFNIVAKMLKSPILIALFQVFMGFAFGGFSFSSLSDVLATSVEATGTFLQQSLAQKMQALENEREAWKHTVIEKQKELEELEKEYGLNRYNDRDYILYLASLPPAEYADDFMSRSLNTDLCRIDLGAALDPTGNLA